MTPEQKRSFLERGFLHVQQLISGELLTRLQVSFDKVWDTHQPRVSQHQLLSYQEWIDLIEYPPLIALHRALFGRQLQLLQYDFLRQEPNTTFPPRAWHRDFSFPGDVPLSANTILFLDDVDEAKGPTRVLPGSHRGAYGHPDAARAAEAHPDEVAVPVRAGDAILINGAVWHTGGRNTGPGLRRGVYLYYGYWWLKRYDGHQVIPWQALAGASEQRLELLGVKMPDRDLHMYDPNA